jgi:hypothetical protein
MERTKAMRATLIFLALAGCASQETMLRNDRGEVRYCYLVHDGSLARIAATGEYTRCLNDAGAAGFHRVER